MIAILSSLAAMQLVVMGARKTRPERAAFAAVLIGWNPGDLHAVGSAHNESLVVLSLAAEGCWHCPISIGERLSILRWAHSSIPSTSYR